VRFNRCRAMLRPAVPEFLPLPALVDVSLLAIKSSDGNVSKLMSSIKVPRTHLELAL
jgi:hypothetical protein